MPDGDNFDDRPPQPLSRSARFHHHREDPWQPRHRRARRTCDPQRRGRPGGQGRPARGADRQAHRPIGQGQVLRARCGDRGRDVVGPDERSDDASAFRRAEGRISSRRWRTSRRSMSPTCSAARSPNTASMCASSTSSRGTICSSARCWCGRPLTSWPICVPEYTIIDLPSFRADPARHGSRSETVIAVNFTEKLILIGGTAYAGEMKKSGVRHPQLPASAQGRDADALFGQHRARWQDRGVLRAFGHRQDHAVGRRQPHADRRR